MLPAFSRADIVRIIIVSLIGVATAVACSWSYITDHSVRFNSYRKGRAFYRLPPLPIMYDSKTGNEIYTFQMNDDEEIPDNNEDPDPLKPDPDELWDQVQTSIDHEDLANSRRLLQRFLSETARPTIDEEPTRQTRRNSAYDLLDTLTALHQGSKVRTVKAYLDARNAFDAETQDFEKFMIEPPADKNLEDNWDYLRAAVLYKADEKEDALIAFQKHLKKYPHSEKNEAARYMSAKISLEISYSFGHVGCGISGKTQWGEDIDPQKVEPTEKCQDENWNVAIKAFNELIQKYPRGRHFNDARGWLAYLLNAAACGPALWLNITGCWATRTTGMPGLKQKDHCNSLATNTTTRFSTKLKD